MPIPVGNMARSIQPYEERGPKMTRPELFHVNFGPVSALYRNFLFFIDYDTEKLSSNLIKRRLVVSLTFSNPIAAVLSELSFSTLVVMSILGAFDTFVYASGTLLVNISGDRDPSTLQFLADSIFPSSFFSRILLHGSNPPFVSITSFVKFVLLNNYRYDFCSCTSSWQLLR